MWGLGVTEHRYGSEVVRLICNLALMCGKVGRPGSALLPLRGQNNVQGSSDMGALPDTFTGYQSVLDDDVAARFEAAWGVEMKRERGLKIPEMFDAAVAGELRAMYIFGEDVAQTDPNTTHVIRALEALEFLVVQEIFENETTRYADVVLPASSFLEKTGTFTNAERRVQLVEAAIDPPGDARTDFEILTTISAALGHEMGFETPADVMDEVASLTPDWAGVSHERVGRGGLQWPVAADGTDSPTLYAETFTLPGGRAQLAALPYKPPGSEASDEFPVILVTGRRLEHYNAGTMTRRTANLDLLPSDWLEIHPEDAARLWVRTARSSRCAARTAGSSSRPGSRRGSSPATSSPRFTSPRSARTCSSGRRLTSTRRARSTRSSRSTCGRSPKSRARRPRSRPRASRARAGLRPDDRRSCGATASATRSPSRSRSRFASMAPR